MLVQYSFITKIHVLLSIDFKLLYYNHKQVQVLALVGFRKVMDFFPSIFSQNELFWLDNIMPESKKRDKKTKKKIIENGTAEVNLNVFLVKI